MPKVFKFRNRQSLENQGKNTAPDCPISIFYLQNFPTSEGAHPPQTPPARARLTQNKCIIFDFQKRLSFGNEGRTATQNRPISICYLQIFPTSEGEHPPQTPPAVLEASIVEDIILSAKEELESKRKNRRKKWGEANAPIISEQIGQN